MLKTKQSKNICFQDNYVLVAWARPRQFCFKDVKHDLKGFLLLIIGFHFLLIEFICFCS